MKEDRGQTVGMKLVSTCFDADSNQVERFESEDATRLRVTMSGKGTRTPDAVVGWYWQHVGVVDASRRVLPAVLKA